MAAQIEQLPDLDEGLDAFTIIEMCERRMNQYAGRDVDYDTFARYYFGKQSGMGSPSAKAMNSQGRPLLRDSDSYGAGDGEYRSQRLAPIVDDYQALLGRMPASRVEPPDHEAAGIAAGQKMTKYLVSTHELSRMDRQQADMGWMLPCLGDSMYMLDIAKIDRAWRVVWNVVDPRCAYPKFRSGYRRFEILDLILREYWDPYEAKARFGSDVIQDLDQGRVPVTIYVSQFERVVVVGGKRRAEVVQRTPWKLPFCPAVWVFNKVNGGMAQSDIAQSLVQQDALDFTTQLGLDGLVISTYGVPVVKGPSSVGADGIVTGPGAPPITVGPDGDFKYVAPTTDLSAIKYLKDALEQEIFAATGSSEARQTGQLHSSIQTGRATHAAQGPQATRIELRQQELGAAFQIANAMTLEMQEKAPHLGNQTFEIYGRIRGKSFIEKFKPKDDINGWYRNSVQWEEMVGMNSQQKGAVASELKAAKVISNRRAMEIVGIDDPHGMQEEIEADLIHEAEMQARVQGIMQGAQGGAPGGGGPPGGAPTGGPGPTGGPPPPTMIARPPGMGADRQGAPQGLPTGVPKGVNRDAVTKALQLVADKLTGTVAVVGEMALVGEGSHIEVLISDYKDFGKVSPVLRALDPKASIKAVPEGKWPSEAVRVI
jgi:hypothetical protein